MKNILVLYISPNGSTAEVADFIGQELKALGHRVDLHPIDKLPETSQGPDGTVPTLYLYDAVVVAAPVNGMNWRPEALNFITQHRAELLSKSVSYVALAMMAQQGRPMWQRAVQKVFTKATEAVPPVATAIFGGVAAGEMPAPMRWVFGLPKDMVKDNRDWQKVEAFARKIHQTLPQ